MYAPCAIGEIIPRILTCNVYLERVGSISKFQQKPEDSFRDEIARVIFGDIGSIRDGACAYVSVFINVMKSCP